MEETSALSPASAGLQRASQALALEWGSVSQQLGTTVIKSSGQPSRQFEKLLPGTGNQFQASQVERSVFAVQSACP